MIVAWIPDENGKVQELIGLFETDEELKQNIVDRLAEGLKVIAGDVTPITIKFVPPIAPDVKISR